MAAPDPSKEDATGCPRGEESWRIPRRGAGGQGEASGLSAEAPARLWSGSRARSQVGGDSSFVNVASKATPAHAGYARFESLKIVLKSLDFSQRRGARRLNASDGRGRWRGETIRAAGSLDATRFVKVRKGGRQLVVSRDRVIDVVGGGDQSSERRSRMSGPIGDRKQHPGCRPGRRVIDGVACARRRHGPTIPEHRPSWPGPFLPSWFLSTSMDTRLWRAGIARFASSRFDLDRVDRILFCHAVF